MRADCLEHCLTDAERLQFEEQGFFVLENALAPDHVKRLEDETDRIFRRGGGDGMEQGRKMFYPNILPESELFVELLDWPRTFPKVWGILGWNIYCYHTHLIVTPPHDRSAPKPEKPLGWHQDSGRVNTEIECRPRPRLSLKVAFFLSDASEDGRGNLYVIPGSHLRDEIDIPPDPGQLPEGAIPVCVPAGSALFFDRRLWHAASHNFSQITRKALFYGYGYRWLRPKDDMTVDHLLERCDPLRRQLLGGGLNANGHFTPKDGDVPLRDWLQEHRPQDAR